MIVGKNTEPVPVSTYLLTKRKFTDFRLTSGDVTGTAIVLLIAGALVGVAGSAFAATRFLDV